MPQAPVDIKVDASEFTALLGKTSALDKKLKAQLRKNIKEAAEVAARASREEVQKTPLTQSQHPRHKGLRAAIAGDIKVIISANSSRGAGVTIKAGTARLGGDRKKLVRAYNSDKGWRHPVFARIHKSTNVGKTLTAIGAGRAAKDYDKARKDLRRSRARWVVQKGRPYFGKVIKQHSKDIAQAVEKALKSALSSLK